MGSATASGAVFRALAENNGAWNYADASRPIIAHPMLDARRVQPRPGRACSPTSEFGLKNRLSPVVLVLAIGNGLGSTNTASKAAEHRRTPKTRGAIYRA